MRNPRWFALRKNGRLVVFDPDNATSFDDYLVLAVESTGEGGLLGMAFHPDHPDAPEIFLSCTRKHSGPAMRSAVSRLILDSEPVPGTLEEVILEVGQGDREEIDLVEAGGNYGRDFRLAGCN